MARSRFAAAGVALASSTAAAAVGIGVLGLMPPVGGAPAAARPMVAADFPTEADYCYVEGMLPHHEQALEMSRVVLAARGVSERVHALAAFIVEDQTVEIEQMAAWSDAWAEAAAGGSAHPKGHADHGAAIATTADGPTRCGHEVHTEMAGMATPEQLAALAAAEEGDAQALFLDLMIVHHEGALVMAQRAVREGSNAFVRASAKHVIVEQRREVEAMTALLLVDP